MTSGNYIFKTNLWKRIVATLLDYGVFFVYMYLYVMLVGHETDEGGRAVTGLRFFAVPAVWFIYFVVVEAVSGGTLGHHALELKVLTIDRRAIGLSEATRRRLLDFIDLFFYGIPAIIAIKNSDRHQRIGDMWARTIVVDTGDPEQYGVGTISISDDEKENYRQRTSGS